MKRASAEDTSLEGIEALAVDCIESLPEPFRAAARRVILRVEDWPDDELLDSLGIDDPLDLTGLYDGVPMTEKSASEPDPYPDVVTLFRQPILAELEDRGNVTLRELVRNVTVHEFAHHFGWSDSDIARVDQWWL
jgi:predicted Zn-dependent protease with MMP-like domain